MSTPGSAGFPTFAVPLTTRLTLARACNFTPAGAGKNALDTLGRLRPNKEPLMPNLLCPLRLIMAYPTLDNGQPREALDIASVALRQKATGQ